MSTRPNILHLFTDMQRWDTIRALGNIHIKTPNLDRLCKEGIAFTNAITPSPVCIAARACMIYGQNPYNTGCYENNTMPTDGRASFMDSLSKAGYRTHSVGKCHFTPDPLALRGFQSREIQEEGIAGDINCNDYLCYLKKNGYEHLIEAFGVRGEMYYVPQPSPIPEKDHGTTWIANRSIEFIRRMNTAAPEKPTNAVSGPAKNDQPWYLFSSFIHPHPPFTPPAPWHKLYRPSMMPLPWRPQQHDSLWTLVNRIQNRYKYRDQGIDQNLVRAIKAYYYACISFVDYQIGRILKALEETNQLDSTLIVFTSDHGEMLGDYDCFGKRSMHDGSVRVPLLARLPGVFEGGERIEQPVSLVDLAPTFLNLAGISDDKHSFDGVDLVRIVNGSCDREFVFSQLAIDESTYLNELIIDTDRSSGTFSAEETHARLSSYMSFSQSAKYIYSAADDAEFYFDRTVDPYESRNKNGIVFCQKEKQRAKNALLTELQNSGERAGIECSDNGNKEWRRFPSYEINPDPDFGLLIQDNYTPWAQIDIPGYTN